MGYGEGFDPILVPSRGKVQFYVADPEGMGEEEGG